MKYYNLEITVSPEHVFSCDVIGCCVLPNFYVNFEYGCPTQEYQVSKLKNRNYYFINNNNLFSCYNQG